MTSDLPAQLVLAHIGSGRDSSKSLSAISEELGWSRRAVELAVRELRLAGSPVCSDGSGIWYSLDPVDLDATIASLRSRMVQQYQTFLALRRTRRYLRQGEIIVLDLGLVS